MSGPAGSTRVSVKTAAAARAAALRRETHRFEGAPVQRTGPMLGEQPLMIGGRVAFVNAEAVLRINRMHLVHIRIPSRLCQDRSRADRSVAGIAADDGTRGQHLAEA